MNKKNDIGVTVLIVGFYMINGMKYFLGKTPEIQLLFSFMLAVIGCYAYYYIFSKNFLKLKKNVVIFSLFFYLSLLIVGMYTENIDFFDLILPIEYFGVALLFLSSDYDEKIAKIAFLFVALYFGVRMLQGISGDLVFSLVSRNNVSILLLSFAFLIYIGEYKKNIIISIWPAFLTFLISIWAGGRSGAMATALLLVGVIFIKYFAVGRITLTKMLKFLVGILIILSLIYVSYVLFYDMFFRDLVIWFEIQGLSDNGRAVPWIEYIHRVFKSPISFFLAAPIKGSLIATVLNGNPHSSFVSLHMYYGTLAFLLMNFFIIRKMSIFLIIDRNYLFFFLMLIILIRGLTDVVNFNGFFDPFLYYLLLYNESREIKNENVLNELSEIQ